jgi:hypothetical protein
MWTTIGLLFGTLQCPQLSVRIAVMAVFAATLARRSGAAMSVNSDTRTRHLSFECFPRNLPSIAADLDVVESVG